MWRFAFLIPAYLFSTALPLAFNFGPNLEYEYSLVAAWLSLILIPLVGFLIPKVNLPLQDGTYAPPVALEAAWVLFISPLFGFLAGVFLFVSGSCECSENGYLFWMLVQWYPAHVLAHVAFQAIVRGRCANVPNKKMALTMAITYFCLIAVVVLELWFSPQKRIVSLFAGFLHGPIYDSLIIFDGGLLLARTAHLFLAIALLSIIWFRGQYILVVSGSIAAVIWIVAGSLASSYPSTVNGQRHLETLMPKKIKGDGFTLHFRPIPPKTSSIPIETTEPFKPSNKIIRLYKEAQFHSLELKNIIGLKKYPHVDIFVYPDQKSKKLWFGGGATDVADVSGPSVHITADTWPHRTLRHELVHALTSDIAFHGLGFHPNMAFTEGLAIALAPQARVISLDEGTASLLQSKRLPDINNLFSLNFWQESGSRAYTAAGSLINFLISKYGTKAVMQLYSGTSWEDAVHETQETVLKNWQEHINAQYNKTKSGLLTEVLYRTPGTLQDKCPHSKVDLLQNRSNSVFVRLRQPIAWDPNKDYLAWLLKLNNYDIETRLTVWRKEIKKTSTDRFSTPGRLKTWRETTNKARKWPAKNYEDIELALIESDLASILGDKNDSLLILDQLKSLSQEKNLGNSTTREISARIAIESTTAGTITRNWRMYLAGWKKSIPPLPANAPWILKYLTLRNDFKYKKSIADLRGYLNEPLPPIDRLAVDPSLRGEGILIPDTNFLVEWFDILGTHFMRKTAFDDASTAFTKALKYASPARTAILTEQRRKAQFFMAQRKALQKKAKN